MVTVNINWIVVCNSVISRNGNKWKEWIITLLAKSSCIIGKNKKLLTRRAFGWKLITRNVRNDVTNGYFCKIFYCMQHCLNRSKPSTKYIWKFTQRS